MENKKQLTDCLVKINLLVPSAGLLAWNFRHSFSFLSFRDLPNQKQKNNPGDAVYYINYY